MEVRITKPRLPPTDLFCPPLVFFNIHRERFIWNLMFFLPPQIPSEVSVGI